MNLQRDSFTVLTVDFSMDLLMYLIVVAIAMSRSNSSPVQDRTSLFSCCDLTVNYSHDLSCDDSWSAKEMNIAVIFGETKSCESPCKEINNDGIILDSCVNLTVDTVCHVNGVIKETRVTFYGQMKVTNGTTMGNKSSVVLLLLTFLIGQPLRFLS